jgi:hypothetical protein
MKISLILALVTGMVLAFVGGGRAAAASGQPAPTPLSPANGAQVTAPFSISWSPVTDPRGIVAYNWEVSPSNNFSPVIEQRSTNGQTQDTVSGLANGTYYWRVQAVNGSFVQGAWSNPQSFKVTGVNSGEPGSPTLNPPQGGSAFHPMEVVYFTWSAVPGATSYNFDASTDPSFPISNEVHFDNIPNTSYSLDLGDSEPQGTWYVRVSAVNANFVQGVPSNVDKFTLSFNAPLPPPSLLGPANGSTVTLPVTLTWTDVPNPQPSGYVLEIADDSQFKNIEYTNNQITGAHWTVTSLTAGTKYWHVLSTQGDSAPDVPANTAWSATGSFVVPATPPKIGSLAISKDPASNGDTETVTVQLTTPAPSGGAVVSLTSSDTAAAPLPATFTVPAGFSFSQFRFQVGAVTTSTLVTVTGTLNGSSASVSFTDQPPALQSLSVFSPISGGATTSLNVMLTGAAPSGGATVSLSSDSPAASPPATATIPAGSQSVTVNVPTSAVTATTIVTLSAVWNGKTVQTQLTLTPQQVPTSLTLNPSSTSGSTGSSGTVTIGSPATSNLTLSLSSSNAAVASVPNSVTVPSGSTTGGFSITTTPVSTQTLVTISVSGAGVTKTATLTVNPSSTVTPTPTVTPSTTPSGPLPAPTLLSPASDTKFSPGQSVSLDWSDVSGAASYEIEISGANDFSSLAVDKTVTVSQFAISTLSSSNWYWRVRAKDSSGSPGAWSTALRFTVT